jgi:hypothetical protein
MKGSAKKKTKSKPASKAKVAAWSKSAARPRKPARPAARPKAKPKPPAKAKAPAKPKKPVPKPPAKAPAPPPPPVKAPAGKAPGAKGGVAPTARPGGTGPAEGVVVKPIVPRPAPKKSRKGGSALRRGFDANRPPGELLLPGGPKTPEEVQYVLRGSVAAERSAGEAGIEEVILKQGPALADPEALRSDLRKLLQTIEKRFESGTIEGQSPARPPHTRRNFQGMVERAKMRRREIGAFLRGLHLGQQETSHMDAHGEASLESLMQWAARLENLAEAEEREQADYGQFHRILDQLESNTEALIVDVELTLRRLRDRVRS